MQSFGAKCSENDVNVVDVIQHIVKRYRGERGAGTQITDLCNVSYKHFVHVSILGMVHVNKIRLCYVNTSQLSQSRSV